MPVEADETRAACLQTRRWRFNAWSVSRPRRCSRQRRTRSLGAVKPAKVVVADLAHAGGGKESAPLGVRSSATRAPPLCSSTAGRRPGGLAPRRVGPAFHGRSRRADYETAGGLVAGDEALRSSAPPPATSGCSKRCRRTAPPRGRTHRGRLVGGRELARHREEQILSDVVHEVHCRPVLLDRAPVIGLHSVAGRLHPLDRGAMGPTPAAVLKSSFQVV